MRNVKFGSVTRDVQLNTDIHDLLKDCRMWISKKGLNYLTVFVRYQNKDQILSHVVLNITHVPIGFVIDHKDRRSLNNCRENLHVVSFGHNAQNKSKLPNCSSKYIGVHWNQDLQTWHVNAKFEGKAYYLGSYAAEQEVFAAKSYDRFVINKILKH